jgi:hypothetical protein
VSVSLSGEQAEISLEAVQGAEGGTDRQYVNFLPTSASIVNPTGVVQQVDLPQVAPGEYQASLPVSTEGVYTLQVTENDADGGQSTQSSGFVVPYSPEYRDLSTNSDFLGALASLTGGRMIQSADEALAHDLPSVGTPRPLWPALLALLVLVLVADVAVRRLRLSGFEVRAGYQAVRSRLGYLDVPEPGRRTRAVRAPVTIHATPLVASAPRPAKQVDARPVAGTSLSQQLLAAKRRAAKR